MFLVPISEMQWSASMRAVVVVQHQAAICKAEEEKRVVPGLDEVEFVRIESYDLH